MLMAMSRSLVGTSLAKRPFVESKNIIPQITSTLEEIQKVNELMRFHQSFEEPDEHALQNFIRLSNDFLQQLDDLMKELNLEVKWREAA